MAEAQVKVEVSTQQELDQALADGKLPVLIGSGRFSVKESSHVVAWESSHVVAWESSHVVASKFVSVHLHSPQAKVEGGVVIQVPKPTTVDDWCEFYGTPIRDGVAILYKTVRADFKSAHGFLYSPGSSPEATDWDGGRDECGGGLHFSPHPAMALEFDSSGTRFVACPVAVADIRPPQTTDSYPHKVKARRVIGPIVEVDRTGSSL